MKRIDFTPIVVAAILVVNTATAVAQVNTNPRTASRPFISYDHIGLQYVDQDLDDFDCSQDGFNAYGSLNIDGNWFARAAISDVSGNNGCGSSTVSAGGGYRTKFNNVFDMYGTLSFESTSPDIGDSDSGLILAGGLRGFIAENLEGKLELAHHTIFDGTTSVNGGVAYWFSPQFAGTVDLNLNSDGNTLAVGARMNF